MTTEHAEISTEFDHLSYVPGERVRGVVSWNVGVVPDAEILLRLFYYTEGRGTQDVIVVEEKSFESTMTAEKVPFEFDLPKGPYSFSGKLVSLIWALELVVGSEGPVERLPITVSPTGQEIHLHAHADADMPSYGSVQLGQRRKKR